MRAPPAFRLLALALGREVSTVDWPEVGIEPEGPPRGSPVVDGDTCTACGSCIRACPSSCLYSVEGEGSPVVDAGGCVRCGICVQTCPEHAISQVGASDLASFSRSALVMDGRPHEEVEVGRAPSALYRKATAGSKRTLIRPEEILLARKGSLDPDGKKDQDR